MSPTPHPPIFAEVTDLIGWTLGRTADLPKSHRFTFGQRLDNTSLEVLRLTIRALYAPRARKAPCLEELNLDIEELRVLWRVVHQQGWIGQNQLVHVIAKLDTIGRMAGGWRQSLARPAAPKPANGP
jgi:hypothetical protein